MRKGAVEALGEIGDPIVVSVLEEVLKDRYSFVREAAEWSLAELSKRGKGLHSEGLRRNRVARKEYPEGWPVGVWKLCWHGEWLHFSAQAWCNLSIREQWGYARAYQEWYARGQGVDVEMKIHIGSEELVMALIPPGQFWMGSPKMRRNDGITKGLVSGY